MSTPSHLLMMSLFSGCVAIVGAVLMHDTLPRQVRAAAEIFGGLMASALVLGWILYVFPL